MFNNRKRLSKLEEKVAELSTNKRDLLTDMQQFDYYVNRNWYAGNTCNLTTLYTQSSNLQHKEFFYSQYQNVKKVHSGMPRLISDTMARVLFSSGYKIS